MCKKLMSGLLGGGPANTDSAPNTGGTVTGTPNPTVINPGAPAVNPNPSVRKAISTPRTTNGVPGLNL